ncbi:hypothetical protein FGO68_gene11046 [Halteria grandinella]|uniref:Uncharacterized protein n=1 Tax=Halteria grandinella TaxID=5974 RepID=A0A8J8ND89_HALGN|nr:hypothetical protein FGO68_gene11046 [Halteria grandinella]
MGTQIYLSLITSIHRGNILRDMKFLLLSLTLVICNKWQLIVSQYFWNRCQQVPALSADDSAKNYENPPQQFHQAGATEVNIIQARVMKSSAKRNKKSLQQQIGKRYSSHTLHMHIIKQAILLMRKLLNKQRHRYVKPQTLVYIQQRFQ